MDFGEKKLHFGSLRCIPKEFSEKGDGGKLKKVVQN